MSITAAIFQTYWNAGSQAFEKVMNQVKAFGTWLHLYFQASPFFESTFLGQWVTLCGSTRDFHFDFYEAHYWRKASGEVLGSGP